MCYEGHDYSFETYSRHYGCSVTVFYDYYNTTLFQNGFPPSTRKECSENLRKLMDNADSKYVIKFLSINSKFYLVFKGQCDRKC